MVPDTSVPGELPAGKLELRLKGRAFPVRLPCSISQRQHRAENGAQLGVRKTQAGIPSLCQPWDREVTKPGVGLPV